MTDKTKDPDNDNVISIVSSQTEEEIEANKKAAGILRSTMGDSVANKLVESTSQMLENVPEIRAYALVAFDSEGNPYSAFHIHDNFPMNPEIIGASAGAILKNHVELLREEFYDE